MKWIWLCSVTGQCQCVESLFALAQTCARTLIERACYGSCFRMCEREEHRHAHILSLQVSLNANVAEVEFVCDAVVFSHYTAAWRRFIEHNKWLYFTRTLSGEL